LAFRTASTTDALARATWAQCYKTFFFAAETTENKLECLQDNTS
jgi:hypothetical protein